MLNILCSHLGGNQFDKAFELYHLPVVARDFNSFLIPSSRDPGESDHLVRVDDPERPGTVSCTCLAGQVGRPCWAMARALIALDELREANVWIFRGAVSARAGREAAAGAVEPLSMAVGFTAAGDLALLERSETSLTGMLLNVP